jgi:hypothetical protein
MFPVF